MKRFKRSERSVETIQEYDSFLVAVDHLYDRSRDTSAGAFSPVSGKHTMVREVAAGTRP